MLLLLDENAASRSLVLRLRSASHNVETSIVLVGAGASDRSVFDAALCSKRVLVTYDRGDFRDLYGTVASHPGLLLIYGDALSTEALAQAIDRVAEMYPTTEDLLLCLNDFQW